MPKRVKPVSTFDCEHAIVNIRIKKRLSGPPVARIDCDGCDRTEIVTDPGALTVDELIYRIEAANKRARK